MKLLNLEILENDVQERFFDNTLVKTGLENMHKNESATYEDRKESFKNIIDLIEDQTARVQPNEHGAKEYISYDGNNNLCTALVTYYENGEPQKLDYQNTASDRNTEKVVNATVEDNGSEIITTFTLD